MLFTIIFLCLMISVFGKLLVLAVKAAWGITKIVLNLVFLPVILIALAFAGMLYIAIPALIIIGLIALFVPAV